MNTSINWRRIGFALGYYAELGYKYVEVPWIVEHQYVLVSLPNDRCAHTTMDGTLVGSAEQSFLQLIARGQLKAGKYVAVTPCFRDDDVDETHSRTFMKVELIEVDPVTTSFHCLVDDALGLFKMLAGARHLCTVGDSTQNDIELAGIEVGSYGTRFFAGTKYHYGTGLAEPRFSYAMEKT